MLYNATEQAPSSEVDTEVATRYYAQFDEQFFHFCEKELMKINTFYNGKLVGLQKDGLNAYLYHCGKFVNGQGVISFFGV